MHENEKKLVIWLAEKTNCKKKRNYVNCSNFSDDQTDVIKETIVLPCGVVDYFDHEFET